MSETPQLQPIAEAFAAADAAAAEAEAKREAKEEARDSEAQAQIEAERWIRDVYRRQGAAMAHKCGRSTGMDRNAIDRLIAIEDEAINGKAEKVKGKKAKRKAEPADGGSAPPDGPPGDIPPADDEEPDGPRFIKKRDPVKALPPDCPVTPVGYNGTTCYFLNPHRQLIPMTKGQFGAEGLRLLFGSRQDWLWEAFPKYNEKTGVQSGWKADQAAESLIKAATDKGWFDADEMIRGMGGWRGQANELVLHCGSAVLVNGEAHPPGFVNAWPARSRPTRPRATRSSAGRARQSKRCSPRSTATTGSTGPAMLATSRPARPAASPPTWTDRATSSPPSSSSDGWQDRASARRSISDPSCGSPAMPAPARPRCSASSWP